ncbi:hypothetical protein F4801DRAFT_574885 [Xylaria longipes]|nr:hypothetical protein F4801DRAFT_574885 [Xylaria longipes]
MPRLVGFFDCFLVRLFLTGEDAGGVQDEQNPAPSVGYRSEPLPTAGYRAQSAGSRLQGSLSNEVLERPNRENRNTASAASEVSSSDYSQTQNQTGVRYQRPSEFEGIDELEISRPRSACSASSTSDLSDDSDIGGDTDDEKEKGEGIKIFYNGFAWRSGRRYRRRSPSSSPPSSTATQPLRLLPSEDMEVIGALFRHPEVHPVPRETEWRDLTRTMTHLGFSVAPVGGGGAARRFQVVVASDLIPTGSEGEVITAHEPHGGRTTLGRRRMREIGRRLTHAFGWSAETFGTR